MKKFRLEPIVTYLIFGSLIFLALGVLTSKSVMSMSHVLISIPCIFFLFKTNWKKFNYSTWALVGMSLAIILSVVVNQDIIDKGMNGAIRSKYFFISILSITPLSWYFLKQNRDKPITVLIYALCIATTFATLAGLIGQFTGYNPILMKEVATGRNGGLFGQLLNYAHNLNSFLIIILGLLINKKQSSRYISYKFLVSVFIINSIGLYMTYSRGPWLGFVAAVPFLFIHDRKKFLVSLILVFVLGGGAYFAAGKNVERSESDSIRISQWKAAIEMVKDKPLMGYGYHNYEYSVKKIKEENKIGYVNFESHAHNNVMEMLAGTGLIGFLFFMLWLGLWFLEMWKRRDIVGQITMAVIVCFFVAGLTQSTILISINLFFIMGVYSLSQVADRKSKI